MTAATALFMIPTALVFPAMMRIANTPPSSETLTQVRKHKTAHKQQPLGGYEQVMSQHDRLVRTQREEFHVALSDGELRVGKRPSLNCLLQDILEQFQSQPTGFFRTQARRLLLVSKVLAVVVKWFSEELLCCCGHTNQITMRLRRALEPFPLILFHS